jgi:hypothetical protein
VEKILLALGKVRETRPKPQRDEKIVANWNGMMITSMARAAIVLGDETYRKAALRAGSFLWDNLRRKDGSMLRSYFGDKAEVEAELVDYAWLGRAYIELYDLSGDTMWLDRAKMLFGEMDALFADKESGDFYSSQKPTSFGRPKSRQDSDLSSGNGIALEFLVALTKRVGGADMQRRTEQLLAALSGFAAGNVASGSSILTAADKYMLGETGPVQFGGGGTVRAQARLDDDGGVVMHIKIAKGWHINGNKPLEDYLVPTTMKVKSGGAVTYPKAIIKSLGFSKKPLALLEGEAVINAKAAETATSSVELEIQACSDKICLAPDTLKFTVSPALPAG